MTHEISVTPQMKVGGNHDRLLLISGPCQIESLDHCLKIGEQLKTFCEELPLSLVFKSSFDKANRTSVKGTRGLGMEEGLRILEEVRRQIELPVLTDVHLPEQVEMVAEVVDVLQTPAFLCRQTDLLAAVGKTGKAVNVKKGQFLAPQDMEHVAEKISSHGNPNILLCERGSCFGYRDLVVDMRGLEIMKSLGYPVIFDATHSVQSMGGNSGSSGGSREFILPLIRAACGLGVDGLFIECHDNPDQAPSDGPSMLPLHDMKKVLEVACRIHQASILD